MLTEFFQGILALLHSRGIKAANRRMHYQIYNAAFVAFFIAVLLL
jgi:hypothetical protein